MDESSAAALDNFVIQYLRQRGFSRAEQSFKQELGARAKSVEEYAASMDFEANASIAKQIQYFHTSQVNSEWYNESYKFLKRWIDSCLDLYRVGRVSWSFSIDFCF
jgi:hypothetical protein